MASLPPGVDPSTIPLLPNPNGDPPNFVDPSSLQPAVLGTGIALIAISAFLVILRTGTNIKSQRKLGVDDCESTCNFCKPEWEICPDLTS